MDQQPAFHLSAAKRLGLSRDACSRVRVRRVLGIALLLSLGWLSSGAAAQSPPPRTPWPTHVRTGGPAPAFGLRRLGARAQFDSVPAYRGTVVLLNFWASWCYPCREDMRELQHVVDAYGARGLRVIGISIDPGNGAKTDSSLLQIARRVGARYPQWRDGGRRAQRALGVFGAPTTFLLDRAGRIQTVAIGARNWLAEPHRSMLEGLLADSLPSARR